MAEFDTIVAISTPPGRGGIGVVRLSGKQSLAIAGAIAGIQPQPRYAHYCRFSDQQRRLIDSGLLLFFKGPHSYTGEDMLELHAHGNRTALNMLVNAAVTLGARQARPGEFTERAYSNHKLDLAQAEAVADLINSVSESAVRSATRSLSGEFSRQIAAPLEALVNLRVQLEGSLDFPDEDTDTRTQVVFAGDLENCRRQLKTILRAARQGVVMQEGITVVIVGPPNVGKSTLLNKLAGRDAAIVTDIPGTTRDPVSEQLLIDDIPVNITDTAGIRETDNPVEQEGVRRARDAAALADLALLIVEHGKAGNDETVKKLSAGIAGARETWVIHNKIDLTKTAPVSRCDDAGCREVFLSAKTGAGLDLFVGSLKAMLGMNDTGEDLFMARARHIKALETVLAHLNQAIAHHAANAPQELVAEELRLAQNALSEITGEFVADDLLGEIFSRFCIGK